MKCPGHRENPPAWFTCDDDGEPSAYIIRNPLGEGGARWAVMPLEGFQGIPVISFTARRPVGSERFVCPIQSDEAYSEVAQAVVASAIAYGYFPDTQGPLAEMDGEEEEGQ